MLQDMISSRNCRTNVSQFFCFLIGLIGVFFLLLKMLNLEVLLLNVSGLPSVVSLVSWGWLNLFTLVFPCFQ